MKLNRKGFMLAEVVVVSVVLATVLVTLFGGLNSISSAYDTRNYYYDIDSLYVAMEINDILIKNNSMDNLVNTGNVSLLSSDVSVKKFMDFYKTTGYEVYSTYFVPFNVTKLNGLKSLNINQTFKEYIDYLNGNIDFADSSYNYIIITQRQNLNDSDDCYYYALKLKY